MARYPGAIWRGSNKHGYSGNDTHLCQGLVIHSAEGGAAGLLSVLDDPNRPASWHFHILKSGTIYQPVDTDNIAWTNGSQEANEKFWGIENEGIRGEPLTEPQYQSLLGVVCWLWETYSLGRPTRQENLWEHREMTRYGAASTSCPSGRIPWVRLIGDLALQEDDMAKLDAEDKRYLAGLMRAVIRAVGTGVFSSPLQGDPNYTEAEHDLMEVLREVKKIPAVGGGPTAAQTKQAVKDALKEGTD